MQKTLFLLLLLCAVQNAEAQRVYAPEKTGTGDVQVTNESLIYIVRPEKIEKMTTSEDQIHIQLKDSAREYFYTLTSLNKGKKLSIKTEDGETIQEGIIRQSIDSGLIISKPIKTRADLGRFLRRIKEGKQPIIVHKPDLRPNIAKFVTTKPDPEEKDPYFESREEIEDMRKQLEDL
ncbi:MAG: hypothetical protein ACI9TY_001378 [Alphaproteobacteria bacterium]|jgi:hypothetical protein